MTITTRSAKAKGRTLQNKVRDRVRAINPELESFDVRSCTMGESGEDVQLTAKARAIFPFTTECKKRKAFAIYKDYDQANRHSVKSPGEPLLVIEADRRKPLAIVDLEVFLAMARATFGGDC